MLPSVAPRCRFFFENCIFSLSYLSVSSRWWELEHISTNFFFLGRVPFSLCGRFISRSWFRIPSDANMKNRVLQICVCRDPNPGPTDQTTASLQTELQAYSWKYYLIFNVHLILWRNFILQVRLKWTQRLTTKTYLLGQNCHSSVFVLRASLASNPTSKTSNTSPTPKAFQLRERASCVEASVVSRVSITAHERF